METWQARSRGILGDKALASHSNNWHDAFSSSHTQNLLAFWQLKIATTGPDASMFESVRAQATTKSEANSMQSAQFASETCEHVWKPI